MWNPIRVIDNALVFLTSLQVEASVVFRSLTDTTIPVGRMMQMVEAFSEFEHAMLRERTQTGLAAARLEGRVGGAHRNSNPRFERTVSRGNKTVADAECLF